MENIDKYYLEYHSLKFQIQKDHHQAQKQCGVYKYPTPN